MVQEVLIKTATVRLKREASYSASLKRSSPGKLPAGYEGEDGHQITPPIVSMKSGNTRSIPKIAEFFRNVTIQIAASDISERLTKRLEVCHLEKSERDPAGLETSPYQPLDDPTSRVNGQNSETQVVCPPHRTVFFTTTRKDRLTIGEVFRNFDSRSVVFNEETFRLREQLNVPKKLTGLWHDVEQDRAFHEQERQALLQQLFPDPANGNLHRTTFSLRGVVSFFLDGHFCRWYFLLCHSMKRFAAYACNLGRIPNDSVPSPSTSLRIDSVEGSLASSKQLIQLVAEGTANRLRPILLTTFTTVAGLLPLAYGLGGQDMYMSPMALALGYGLVFATPLTLVPSFYIIGYDIKRLFTRSREYKIEYAKPHPEILAES